MTTDNIHAIIVACNETLKMMQAYHYDAQALVCPKIYGKSFSCDDCPVKDDHRKLFTKAAIEQMRDHYKYLRSSSYGMYVDTDIASTKKMILNSFYGRMIGEPKSLAEMLINFCNYYFGSDPAYYSDSSDETEKREAKLAMKVMEICNDELRMDKESN